MSMAHIFVFVFLRYQSIKNFDNNMSNDNRAHYYDLNKNTIQRPIQHLLVHINIHQIKECFSLIDIGRIFSFHLFSVNLSDRIICIVSPFFLVSFGPLINFTMHNSYKLLYCFLPHKLEKHFFAT